MRAGIIFAIALLAVSTATGGLYYGSFSTANGDGTIPNGGVITDGGAPVSGLSSSITVSGMQSSIVDISVTVKIAGGYNGDLYGYLVGPTGGIAILLNRVGRTSQGDISTYVDSGFNITLSDSAANGDIHNYQNGANPNGGGLTGSWQPDGRYADPASVTDQSDRTAMLSTFDDLNPNGTWTLTFFDWSQSGDPSVLQSWGLEVNAVPEPVTIALPVFGGLFALFRFVRRVRSRHQAH